jgi:CBS domain containing-hemolysin-like protein
MILKPVHFVPPTKKVDEMFDYFQEHNTRVAIILGEYGEVLGIVTMKDVLTFIFGEISGAMEGQKYFKEEDENSYIVPGDMRLSDFYNLTNFDIEDPVMCTIGGVAFRLFDKLPVAGDKVSSEGYEFVTKEVKGLRISKVLVRKLAEGLGSTEEIALEAAETAAAEAGKPVEGGAADKSDAEKAKADDKLPAKRRRKKKKKKKEGK